MNRKSTFYYFLLLLALSCIVRFIFYVIFDEAVDSEVNRFIKVQRSIRHSSYLSLDDIPTVNNDINCTALFLADTNEVERSKQLIVPNRTVEVVQRLAESLINQTKNCSSFLSQRRYAQLPVNREEAEFPLAFTVLLFKDVDQFERLLRAIYRPQNIYCVHVDIKASTFVKRAVRSIVSCFENVFHPRLSFNVYWGSFSVLAPELSCMAELLRRNKKWKYFINLTGQEFPLKTNWQLVRIMKALNGTNNMEGRFRRRNMGRYHGRLPAPLNITVTKGSVHIIAKREYVDFAINSKAAKVFLGWVKKTGVPDETYFSSLNYSPQIGVPGAYLGEPETDPKTLPFLVRYKNWGRWKCFGKFVHAICIFGVGDLPRMEYRQELFANKFHADYQPLAYDCIEELHYRRLRREVASAGNYLSTFNSSLYSNFEFVRNHI